MNPEDATVTDRQLAGQSEAQGAWAGGPGKRTREEPLPGARGLQASHLPRDGWSGPAHWR